VLRLGADVPPFPFITPLTDETSYDAHIVRHVCGCVSVQPELPHQKTKRETSDGSKSKLNQAS